MKRIPTVVELGYVHARCVGGSVPWHHVMRWAGEIRWGIVYDGDIPNGTYPICYQNWIHMANEAWRGCPAVV